MKSNLVNYLFVSILLCSSCSKNSSHKGELSSSNDLYLTNSFNEEEFERIEYTNPCKIVNENGEEYFASLADPDIILGDDGYYYLYPTNTVVEKGNRGKLFDRGPIFRSENLIEWTWCGSVFDDYPTEGNWGTKGAQIWAPGIVKIGSMYNYYYSLTTLFDSNPGIGVATSPTPYGPWTHYGKVVDTLDSGVINGIDPQVFVEEDGRVFLIWGSFYGVACIELTIDGIEPLYGSDYKKHLKWIVEDNTDGIHMNIDSNFEGSYIIKRNNLYYYFGSQGSCCSGSKSTYKVKVGVSDNLFGPYVSSNGLFLHEEPYGDLVIGPSEDVAGVGHNSIIQDYAGDYWIVYHGYDINGSNSEERSLFIDKLLWDEESLMPYVENRKASTTKKIGPLIKKVN